MPECIPCPSYSPLVRNPGNKQTSAMSVPIDIHDLHALREFSLPRKAGGTGTLVSLSPEHIDQILSLQDEVFGALSEDERAFLVKKNRAFFEAHFSHGNIVLGIVHDGHLVAQSVIVNPTTQHPKTGMVDMALTAKPEQITVLQGISVHPDYRGNRLMTVMVDAWLAEARRQNRTEALAEVAVGNHYSWSVFMKEGLRIDSLGIDPADGTQVYNVTANVTSLSKQRLKRTFNRKAARHGVTCPKDDLKRQRELLAEGYKGVKFNPANGDILFRPSKRAPKPRP